MTDKEFVLSIHPTAEAFAGDDPNNRIIMIPKKALSCETGWAGKYSAEEIAWEDAARRLRNSGR